MQTFHLYVILIFTWLLSSACQTYSLDSDAQGDGPWSLKSFPIRHGWTKQDIRHPFIVAALPKTKPIPQRYVLPDLPAPGHQGNQASGTAWAVGYFGMSYYIHKHKKANSAYRCSPAFLYNSLNRGRDQGIEIVDALVFLKEQGCPREELMPYIEKDHAYQPSSRAKAEAASYRIDGFGRVDYSDMDQIRAHLLQGRVIIVTMLISENFVTLDKELWEPEGKRRGRHTMAMVGYDDRKRLIYVLNSVGKSWAKEGGAAISYSWFVRLCKQAYVFW